MTHLKATHKLSLSFNLLLITTLLIFLVLIATYCRSSFSASPSTNVFYLFSSLFYSFAFAVILFTIFYLPFLFVFKNIKVAVYSYLIASIIFQSILLIDHMVFVIYQFHIYENNIISMFLNQGSDVFVFGPSLYVKILIGFLLFVFLPYFFLFKFCMSRIDKPIVSRVVIVVVTSFFLIIGIVTSLSYMFYLKNGTQEKIKSVQMIPFFQASTMQRVLSKFEILSYNDLEKAAFYVYREQMNYPKHKLLVDTTRQKYNILHIMIDSWNPSTFTEEIMPNTMKFTKEKGVFFSNHYSSANATHGGTYGMFFSIPCSYAHSSFDNGVYPVFFDELLANNYDVQIFPSAELPNQELIFKQIPNLRTKVDGTSAFEADTEITRLAIDSIQAEKRDKSFYYFLFYDLAHAIMLPKEYNQKFKPAWSEPNYLQLSNQTDSEPFFNLYKNCIYYIDQQIGKVLSAMKNEGLLENTIIIITGDHGQEFNENKKNYWGHYSNYSDWQIKVPFILYDPREKGGVVQKHMTTHYDFVPSLLTRALNLKNPSSDFSVGHDLLDTITRYPLLLGDFNNYSAIVLDSTIVEVNHQWTTINYTDRYLNPISQPSIDKGEVDKIMEQKTRFLNK